MAVADCIFCKIVAGQIPCKKLYEDDHSIAFMDINPISDGHVLLVAKEHVPFIHECKPETIASVTRNLPKVANAVSKAMNADGYNVLCNNGSAAGQEVPHMHFHIIPRNDGDGVFTQWPAFQYPEGKAEMIYEEIIKNL